MSVEILEPDMTPDPDRDDPDMERWWRRGIPQARHSHTCLALGRQLLKTQAPEILAALLAAGAQEIPSGAHLSSDGHWSAVCDDEELVALACRRPLLEAVLRRHARECPGVSFRDGVEVAGLCAKPQPDPTPLSIVAAGPGHESHW
jgi:hypothetical protein